MKELKPDKKNTSKYSKEDALRQLELINTWIGNMDSKVSVIMAFLAVMLGVITSQGVMPVMNDIKDTEGCTPINICIMLVIIAMYVFCVGAMLMAFGALVARTKNPNKKVSLLFFGTIASMPLNDFKAHILNRSDDEVLMDILEQIHTNACICAKKSKYYNWCLRSSVGSVIAFSIFVLLEGGLSG